MAGCITSDYKEILVGLVADKVAHEMLGAILKTIPLCPSAAAAGAGTMEVARAVRESTRQGFSERWPAPTYIDENGVEKSYSSISKLLEVLGIPTSGTQVVCDISGEELGRCKSLNQIDSLRFRGYTVEGNGEPRKVAEGGKKLRVIHPDAIKTEE